MNKRGPPAARVVTSAWPLHLDHFRCDNRTSRPSGEPSWLRQVCLRSAGCWPETWRAWQMHLVHYSPYLRGHQESAPPMVPRAHGSDQALAGEPVALVLPGRGRGVGCFSTTFRSELNHLVLYRRWYVACVCDPVLISTGTYQCRYNVPRSGTVPVLVINDTGPLLVGCGNRVGNCVQ